MNYYDSLISAARRWPRQTAIIDEFGSLTFRELWDQADQLRQAFARTGISEGHGVGITTGNNRFFIIALYATLACDAVAMPVAPSLSRAEFDRMIEAGQLHFIVADKSRTHLERAVASFSHPSLSLFQTRRSLLESTATIFARAAVMRFTSGTTGKAKCVVLSHRTLWERTEAANRGLRLTSTDRVLWVLPMAYHFVVSILLYVRYGVGIIVAGDFAAESLLEKANIHNATVMYGSPFHVRLLTKARSTRTFTTLKRVISTTTAISPEICKTFSERYSIPVSQALGIMEVGLPIINDGDASRRPEAVGRPVPAFQISILDDAFRPLPPEQTGRLAIAGPGMFDGYLDPPLPADTVLHKGMFLTGDLATQTKDGLIIIRGRANAAIHVSGIKVFPEEIESVLMQYPGVKRARAFSHQHELLGEVVAAEIEWEDPIPFDQEDMLTFCGKYLSAHKIPYAIRRVEKIELTSSGKITRH